MVTHVLQWLVTNRIAALPKGFIIISDLNSILASVAILLLSIVVETVCGNLLIAPGALIQAKVT